MTRSLADKTLLSIALTAILMFTAGAGNTKKPPATQPSKSSSPNSGDRKPGDHNPDDEPLYLGQDWESNAGGDAKPKNGAKSGSKDAKGTKPAAQPQNADTYAWVLVIGTYTEGDHAASARAMIEGLRTIAPQVQGVRVHTTPKGSMVVYGKYTDRDDPKAKADIERLKAISYQGVNVFERVILTRIDLRLTEGKLHPNDLIAARRAHPKVDPLYTLDVAIWDNFDNTGKDRMTYDEIRKRAEDYAAKLRTSGYEAYFYHDDANERSTVTVGLFDRRAINSTSGLYSDEVEALLKKFPARLANGEPLMKWKDEYHPKLGTVPQKPLLSLVPTM